MERDKSKQNGHDDIGTTSNVAALFSVHINARLQKHTYLHLGGLLGVSIARHTKVKSLARLIRNNRQILFIATYGGTGTLFGAFSRVRLGWA